MQITSMHFKATASAKLANASLQAALNRLQGNFVRGRADRVAELGNYEEIRTAAAAIRDRALANLDLYLREFERNATARGTVVHWAGSRSDVNAIVCEIARRHGAKKAVKSKSMVTEECALNDALAAAGIEVVETDLGEYILQLAREPPSHIVAPVVHKSRDEVSDLFHEKHGTPRKTDIAALAREAREMLRLAEDARLSHGYLENQVFSTAVQRGKEIIWRRAVPNSGRPVMNDFVPSMGSSTQTNSASGLSAPYSSPITPWVG